MDAEKLRAHVWQKEHGGKLTVGLGSILAQSTTSSTPTRPSTR